jgi:hypothetical protein
MLFKRGFFLLFFFLVWGPTTVPTLREKGKIEGRTEINNSLKTRWARSEKYYQRRWPNGYFVRRTGMFRLRARINI